MSTTEKTSEAASVLSIGDLVGRPVFVRAVTNYFTGRLTACGDGFLVLADAAWVADTGRFANALAKGELNEVEPYPGLCLVSIGAVVDVSPWDHELPRNVQ